MVEYHVDGRLVPADEAAVSVRDRGFRYGDAASATVRVYGGEPFAWPAHVDRLRRAREALGLDAGPDEAALRERVEETLAANDLADAAVRVSVTRGAEASPGTVLPSVEPTSPTVVVTVAALPRGGQGRERAWDAPAAVQTVRTRRAASEAIPPHVARAGHGRTNDLLAAAELRRAATDTFSADEALVRDPEGFVVGGAASDLFFVADDALRTPGLDGPVVAGVTRETVLDLAESEGIPTEAGRYAPEAVREADEAFLTNSVWELRPVGSVDGVDVGDGPITRLLSGLFDRTVERRHYGTEES